MPTQSSDAHPRGPLLLRRNLLLLGAAVVTIIAGYIVLGTGAAEVASVLLVIGYCVLFPVALIV